MRWSGQVASVGQGKEGNEHRNGITVGTINDIKSSTYVLFCGSAHDGHGRTIASPCRTGEILFQ